MFDMVEIESDDSDTDVLGKQNIFPMIEFVGSMEAHTSALDFLNLKNSSNASPIVLYIP